MYAGISQRLRFYITWIFMKGNLETSRDFKSIYLFLKEMVRKSKVDLLSHELCDGYLKMKWFSNFIL